MSAGYKKINLAQKTQLKKFDKETNLNPSMANDDKLDNLKKVLLRKVSSNQNESAILPNVQKYNYQETPGNFKDKTETNKYNILNQSKTTSRRKIKVNESSVKTNHINSSVTNNGKDYITFLNTQKTTLRDGLKDKFYLRKKSMTRSPKSSNTKNFADETKNLRSMYQKDELKMKTTNSKHDVKNYKIDFSYIYDKNPKKEYNVSAMGVGMGETQNGNGSTTNKSVGRKINESIKSKRNLTSNSYKDSETAKNAPKLILTPNNNTNFLMNYKDLSAKNKASDQRYYISPGITKKNSSKRERIVSKTVDISNITNSNNVSNNSAMFRPKAGINISHENEGITLQGYNYNAKKIKIDKGYLIDATMNISKNVKQNMINSMTRRHSGHKTGENGSHRNSRGSVNYEERNNIKIASLNNSAYEVTRKRDEKFVHNLKIKHSDNTKLSENRKNAPVQFYLTDTTKNKRSKDETTLQLRNSSIVTKGKQSTESLKKNAKFGGLLKSKDSVEDEGKRPASNLKLDLNQRRLTVRETVAVKKNRNNVQNITDNMPKILHKKIDNNVQGLSIQGQNNNKSNFKSVETDNFNKVLQERINKKTENSKYNHKTLEDSLTINELNRGLKINTSLITPESQERPMIITKKDSSKKLKESNVANVTSQSNIHQEEFMGHKYNPSLSKYKNYYIATLKTCLKGLPCREKKQVRAHFLNTLQSTMYRQINFGTKLPPVDKTKMVDIPNADYSKKLLIFDLDETLIHCKDNDVENCMVRQPVTFSNGVTITAGINIRLYTKELLDFLKPHFDLIIFTASHHKYANTMVDILDKPQTIFKKRVFRDNCYKTPEGVLIKDQRIFVNNKRSQKDIIQVTFNKLKHLD